MTLMLNHKTLSIMLGMLLLIVGSAAYAALPPRVSWTPAQLTPASMEPGTSMSHTVVLKHTGILPIPATNQLRIVVEGAIAPSVTIIQPQFPSVFKRGNQVTVPITISVPANTPAGEKKGNLVLKRILPNGKENEVWRADVLPVTVTVTPTCILPQVLQNGVCVDNDNSGLPPDPGEAGKQTLLGIDSDNDGVRDDIQRYIYYTYPDEEKARLALTEVAKQFQILLTQSGDPIAALDNATKNARHLECLYFIKGEIAGDITTALRAEILNTRERSLAYIQYNDSLAGTIIEGRSLADWKSSCAFDIDAVGGVQ